MSGEPPTIVSVFIWHDVDSDIHYYARYPADSDAVEPTGPWEAKMFRFDDDGNAIPGPEFLGGDHAESVVSLGLRFQTYTREELLDLSCDVRAGEDCPDPPEVQALRWDTSYLPYDDQGPGTDSSDFVQHVIRAIVDFHAQGMPASARDRRLLASENWFLPTL